MLQFSSASPSASPSSAASFDLAAYLTRIHYTLPTPSVSPSTSSLASSLALLSDIHRHHLLYIPFENLDVLRFNRVSMNVDDVTSQLITNRRGGYCFQMNTLLKSALQALGFDVTASLARVRWLKQSHEHTTYTHMVLIVTLPDEDDGTATTTSSPSSSLSLSPSPSPSPSSRNRKRLYFCDVGFGGLGSITPLFLGYTDDTDDNNNNDKNINNKIDNNEGNRSSSSSSSSSDRNIEGAKPLRNFILNESDQHTDSCFRFSHSSPHSATQRDEADPDHYVLLSWQQRAGEYLPMLKFRLSHILHPYTPRTADALYIDFQQANWHACTFPDARWVTCLFAAIVKPDEKASAAATAATTSSTTTVVGYARHHLLNSDYTIRHADGSATKRHIETRAELFELLSSVFTLNVPTETKFPFGPQQ